MKAALRFTSLGALLLTLDPLACSSGSDDAAANARGTPADAAPPGPSVVSVSRENSDLHVTLDTVAGIYGVWAEYCERPLSLLKRNASDTDWEPLARRPTFCSGSAYYLGTQYVGNSCLGCDGGDPCHELSSTLRTSTFEYVQTGTRAAPGTGDASTASMLPVFEQRDTAGPYMLVIPYHVTPSCHGAQDHEVRLLLDVQ